MTFGPKPRAINTTPPRSMRRQAYKMAWSDRFSSDAVVIVRDLGLEKIKTKDLLSTVLSLGGTGRVLVTIAEHDEVIEKSGQNLKWHSRKLYAGGIKEVKVMLIDQVTVRDILVSDKVIMTEDSVKRLQERIERV